MLNKLKIVLLLMFLISQLIGCNKSEPEGQQPPKNLIKLSTNPSLSNHKKVVLIVVDSLEADYIDYGLAIDKAPALKYLIDHGQYYKNMVSSFPTMSVVIDSTLLTGSYPDQHHVPGLAWYDAKKRRVVNYGTGNQEVMANGFNYSLEDFFLHLNQDHLNPHVKTLYEELSDLNKSNGSINGIIFRGKQKQVLAFRPWVHIPTKLPKQIQVNAPDFFAFGAFANPYKKQINLPDGPTKQMGFNDEYSLKTGKTLIKEKHLPDFLLLYLPDLDKEVHNHGPNVKAIVEIDQKIKSILDSFPSWDEAIQEVNILVMGDSGQTKILSRSEDPVISLPNLLTGIKLLPTGETASNQDEVAIAVNERSAFIYILKENFPIDHVISALQKDSRIDQLVWEENGWIHVQRGRTESFEFQSGGEFKDPYGQTWAIRGDDNVLDLHLDQEKKTIQYDEYPDALRRLEASLHSHQGSFIIANAKPGYTFNYEASPKHYSGGGHGSLHAKDSYVPLIIVGTEKRSKSLRIVDLKPYILDLLNTK